MTFNDDEQIHSIQNGAAGKGKPKERDGLDLVIVLDISENMKRKDRLDKQKKATEFLIKKLGPTDRVSVVTFSGVANRLCALRTLNKESKKDILDLLNGITCADGANISQGLKMALQVLNGRKFVQGCRSVGIILISSAEQDGSTKIDDISVYTFGFGTGNSLTMPHVPDAMSRKSGTRGIADVEYTNDLKVAFANCFSGLLTVVIQDLKLMMSTGSMSMTENVYADTYDSTVSVMLGNLYNMETRKVIDPVLPPITSLDGLQVLKVAYKYFSEDKKERIKKQVNSFTQEERKDRMLELPLHFTSRMDTCQKEEETFNKIFSNLLSTGEDSVMDDVNIQSSSEIEPRACGDMEKLHTVLIPCISKNQKESKSLNKDQSNSSHTNEEYGMKENNTVSSQNSAREDVEKLPLLISPCMGTYHKQAESSNMDHINSCSKEEDKSEHETVTPSEVAARDKDNAKKEEEKKTITASPGVAVRGSVNKTPCFSTSSVGTYQMHTESFHKGDMRTLATDEYNGKGQTNSLSTEVAAEVDVEKLASSSHMNTCKKQTEALHKACDRSLLSDEENVNEETTVPSSKVAAKVDVEKVPLISASRMDACEKQQMSLYSDHTKSGSTDEMNVKAKVTTPSSNSLRTDEDNLKKESIVACSEVAPPMGGMEKISLPESSANRDPANSSALNEDTVKEEPTAKSFEISQESKHLATRGHKETLLLPFYLPQLINSNTLHVKKNVLAPASEVVALGNLEIPSSPGSSSRGEDNLEKIVIVHSSEENLNKGLTVYSVKVFLQIAATEIQKFRGGLASLSTVGVAKTQKKWRILQELGKKVRSVPSESKIVKKATLLSIVAATIYYMLHFWFGNVIFEYPAPGKLLTGIGFYNPFWLLSIVIISILALLVGAYMVTVTSSEVIATGDTAKSPVPKSVKKEDTNLLAQNEEDVTEEITGHSSTVSEKRQHFVPTESSNEDHTSSSASNEQNENVKEEISAHPYTPSQKHPGSVPTEIKTFRARLAGFSTCIAITQNIWRSLQEHGNTIRNLPLKSKTMKDKITIPTSEEVSPRHNTKEFSSAESFSIDHFESEHSDKENVMEEPITTSSEVIAKGDHTDSSTPNEDSVKEEPIANSSKVSHQSKCLSTRIYIKTLALPCYLSKLIFSITSHVIKNVSPESSNKDHHSSLGSKEEVPPPVELSDKNHIASLRTNEINVKRDASVSSSEAVTTSNSDNGKKEAYVPSSKVVTTSNSEVRSSEESSDKVHTDSSSPNNHNGNEGTTAPYPKVSDERQHFAVGDYFKKLLLIFHLPKLSLSLTMSVMKKATAYSSKVFAMGDMKKFSLPDSSKKNHKNSLVSNSENVMQEINTLEDNLEKEASVHASRVVATGNMKILFLRPSSPNEENVKKGLTVDSSQVLQEGEHFAATENQKFRRGLTGLIRGVVAITQKLWRSLQDFGKTVRSMPSESQTVKKATLLSIVAVTIYYMLCVCFGKVIFEYPAPGKVLTGTGFYNPFWLLSIVIISILALLVGAYKVTVTYSEVIATSDTAKCPVPKSFNKDDTNLLAPNDKDVTEEITGPSSTVSQKRQPFVPTESSNENHTSSSASNEQNENVKEEISAHPSTPSQKHPEIKIFRARLAGFSTCVAITQNIWRSMQEHGNTIRNLLLKSKTMKKAALLSVGLAMLTYIVSGCFGNATLRDLAPGNC
ncbi:uncharacterized protein LOC141670735 isoform X2 [Apium graveolens]|uniref:uncharacterized protein LOC141670735 isoform X2 n=1 Tax=Apium graveolens TaxID=4045 RepID=UPI003D7BE4F1